MKKNTFVTLLFVAAVSYAIGIVMKDQILQEAMAKTQPENYQSAVQYKECFGATLWLTAGRRLNNGYIPEKTVKVPVGWTVVGGGYGPSSISGDAEPIMILCKY